MSMRPVFKRLLVAFLFVVWMLGIAFVVELVQRRNSPMGRLKRALAESRELVSEKDFFGDHSRQLTGRLDPAKFTSFARDLGFIGEPRRNVSPSGLFIAGQPDGWEFPATFDEAYHESGPGGYQVTWARAGDRVFFEYVSW